MVVHENLWPILKADSWKVGEKRKDVSGEFMTIGGPGSHYVLPAGPSVKTLIGELPLVQYSIGFRRREAELRLSVGTLNFRGVTAYLKENASILMEAMGIVVDDVLWSSDEPTGHWHAYDSTRRRSLCGLVMHTAASELRERPPPPRRCGKCQRTVTRMRMMRPEPESHVVLGLPGLGWDSEAPDWAGGYSLIKKAIDALEPSIGRLRNSASQHHAEQLEKWPHIGGEDRTNRTVTIKLPEIIPELFEQRAPRKSFWQRLFGG